MKRYRNARYSIALAVGMMTAASVHAADKDGQFAIKGGGLQSCENFLKAVDGRTNDLAAFGGWIEGYLTGQNQRINQTYDIMPWQTTQTLIGVMASICRQMAPETRFVDALDNMVRIMIPSRLPEASVVRTLTLNDQSAVIYKDVVTLIRLRLNALGHDAGEEDSFGTQMRDALTAFQTEKGLPATGFPDQRTLLALFVANVKTTKE